MSYDCWRLNRSWLTPSMASPLLRSAVVMPSAAFHLQELARRGLGIAVPDHAHDLGRIDHRPPGLALQPDQSVRPDLHTGQLLVLGRGEPDRADPGNDDEYRPRPPSERLEQVADRLGGHKPSSPHLAAIW